VYIAKAFAHQHQFLTAISRLANTLPSGVVSLTPRLGTDWNGESAVYFEIVIADDSVPRSQLLTFTKQISQQVMQHIRPLEDWGVLSYFNFLTQSDAARMAHQPS
jgi:hypothetical protein